MEKVRIGKSDVYTIKLGLGTNKVGYPKQLHLHAQPFSWLL